MEKTVTLKTWQRVLIVVMGGFLMGGMWRMRGDAGYGSFWGMLAVSLAYCLFLCSVLPPRNKMNYFLFPWLVLSMPITVNGWGTLNLQPAGVMNDPVGGTVFFNPASGIFIMLCLGFCWIPVFSFLIGRYYSGRQYRVRDFLLVAAVYFAVKYLFMATLSHPIMQLACGDATKLFVKGLATIGNTDSPWKVFLNHYNDRKWAENIIGGRNYFTSANIIASVAGTFAIMGTVRFWLKDKLTARLMLRICIALSISILAADVFHILGSGGYHLNSFKPPQWLRNNSWGYWEYFTGFFAGLSITAVLINQAKKSGNNADISDKLPDPGKNKWAGYVYYLVVFCAGALCADIVRVVASRLDQHGIFSDEGISMGITIPVMAVPAVIIFAAVLYRNIIKRNLGRPFNADLKTFALAATPVVFSLYTFIDLCVGFTFWDEPARFGLNFLVGLSLLVVLTGWLILWKTLKASSSLTGQM